MNCRKCGGNATKRRNGTHSCRHCGTMPGLSGLDRSGSVSEERPEFVPDPNAPPYIIGAIRPVLARAKGAINPV